MKIDKIKKTGKKYKIEFDSGMVITTYEDVILQNGLLFHRYINEKLLKKIIQDTHYYKSYNKILDMISRRLRSEYEVRNYLKKDDIVDSDIEEIVESLKRIGLIDDRNYARAYTNDRINLSLDGPYKIRKHLEENRISEEYIEEAIFSIDKDKVYSHIEKIIDRKIKANSKYTPYVLRQKVSVYLINLGYSMEDVNEVFSRKVIDIPDLRREMDKVLNKLKKKYSGDKLIYNLKGKLYSKGFTSENIEEYLKDSSLL